MRNGGINTIITFADADENWQSIPNTMIHSAIMISLSKMT